MLYRTRSTLYSQFQCIKKCHGHSNLHWLLNFTFDSNEIFAVTQRSVIDGSLSWLAVVPLIFHVLIFIFCLFFFSLHLFFRKQEKRQTYSLSEIKMSTNHHLLISTLAIFGINFFIFCGNSNTYAFVQNNQVKNQMRMLTIHQAAEIGKLIKLFRACSMFYTMFMLSASSNLCRIFKAKKPLESSSIFVQYHVFFIFVQVTKCSSSSYCAMEWM